MGYEKKYNEALERAKKFKENPKAIFFEEKNVHVSDYIFPELQESEDERIRKVLIDLIYKIYANTSYITCDEHERMLAWLEKQGEKLPVGFYYVNSEGKKFYSDTFKYGNVTLHVEKQSEQEPFDYENATIQQKDFAPKSVIEATTEEMVDNTNEVEPKFDADDWVVRKDGKNFADGRKTVRITRFDGERYWFDSGTYLQPKDIRLWTIKDAKAGDVLTTVGNEYSFIYKGCLDPKHPNSPVAYCGLDLKGELCVNSRKSNHWWTDTTVHPATKEQRDLLFSKMHEAGYEWDEKKLELKKIASDNEL